VDVIGNNFFPVEKHDEESNQRWWRTWSFVHFRWWCENYSI